MTVATSSVGDESCQKFLVDVAERNLVRAIRALDSAIGKVETGEISQPAEVPKLLGDLRKAMQSALDERKRFDEQQRKQGGLGAGELDLGAARSEIFDRLDRLKR